MAKKNLNIDNPAMQFISPQGNSEPIAPPPKGFKVNPLYIETKSKRLQLLIKPSTYDKLKTKAKNEGTSINDLVNRILENI